MKKLLMALLVLILLFAVGCGADKDLTNEELQENQEENINDMQTDNNVNQELVNFICVLGETQEYYFLKDRIKTKSPSGEGWLIDDAYYMKVALEDKEYLVRGDVEEAEITTEDMRNMYRTATVTPGLTCTIGGVAIEDVTLPQLDIITSEEFAEKMLEAMMP